MIQIPREASLQRQHILGRATVLGVLVVLLLITVGVVRHPASVQGSGSDLLRMDIALLLVYGVAGILVWNQVRPEAVLSVSIGTQLGVLLGAVQIANHLIEAFVPVRPFVLIISPVFLMLTLLGTAGAAVCERTKSLMWAVTSGVWCAIVATLIALSFAICFNQIFASRVDWQLREAFGVSGMPEPGSFRVRNILEASSEILVRMPISAACLSFIGAAIQAWINGVSRRAALVASFLTPFMFAAGALALWHANSLERATRPPFVMSGVLLAGVALCAAYPIGRYSMLHLGVLRTANRTKFISNS